MELIPTARLFGYCYVIGSLLTAWASPALLAAPAVDQDALNEVHNFGIAPGIESYIAQTFTVGSTGLLSRIDLQMLRYSGATTAPTFEIRSTTDGVPGATAASVLYQTTIGISNLPLVPGPAGFLEPVNLDVSSAKIMVNAGDVLAISMQSPSTGHPDWTLWTGRFDDPYPQGARYNRSNPSADWFAIGGEYGFRTWVDSTIVAGDFDIDGDVDGRDFLAWQRNTSGGNLADWQANYGASELQAATSVPEPSAAHLLTIGVVGAAIATRR